MFSFKRRPLIYVAGKYMDYDKYEQPYLPGIEQNIALSEKASLELIKKGWSVLTPHKNTSGYEKYEKLLEVDNTFWYNWDFEQLHRCDAIFMLLNWEDSKGAIGEKDFCEDLNIPVFYEKEGYPESSTDLIRFW